MTVSADTQGTTPALTETQRQRRGHAFYPSATEAAAVPPLYATDGVPFAEKVLALHYFGGPCDWWLTEYEPATGIGFGYACLGDTEAAEWGYVSLPEIEALCMMRGLLVIERDLNWTPVTVAQAKLPGRRACPPEIVTGADLDDDAE
jgi:hypothetical protein